VKSFVRGHTKIGECSLKQWLAMDHMPELKAIELEAVYPGRNQRDRRYRNHPAIKTFLDTTSLEPTVDGRPLRVDYYGSSEANKRANLERAHTWFLHARVRFLGNRNFSNVLADRKERQEACLQAASLISFACSAVSGTESEHPGTVQVQILLHGKAGNPVRRGTVETWLPLGGEIEELRIEPIRPGERRPYTSHPTVQRFHRIRSSARG